MIESILTFAKKGSLFVREHPQLLMTLLLLLVIPIAFLVSGQQFLDVGRDMQSQSERERIGLLHDSLESLMYTVAFDQQVVQDHIVAIGKKNPDLVVFELLRETPSDTFEVFASIATGTIGSIVLDDPLFRLAQIEPGASVEVPFIQRVERYQNTVRLVRSQSNETFYIHTRNSLKHADDAFAARIRGAYYWLFGSLAVVLVLLVRQVRLIDYRYLYAEAQKANQTRDLFTNMITHELRTPLTAIRGYASVIREDRFVPEPAQTAAARIEESAARLIALTTDLLDVARIQSGKLSIDKQVVDLGGIVERVFNELHGTANEKQIALRIEGLHEPVKLYTDPKRLHQVLVNLVSNALKYTEEGDIAIEYTGWKDRHELRIKDTGMGIDAESQKKLFAPFFRVKSETVDAISGTGLGMWITKRLTELLEGSIAVESIRGVGTHVILTFSKDAKELH